MGEFVFFLFCSSGELLYEKGSWKKYITKVVKGTKVGVLVDMFRGDLKFFINGEDKGYVL